jgi:hypothetical protein
MLALTGRCANDTGVIDRAQCDFPRLFRIGPGDALMRLRPNRRNVTRSRRAPQVCGQQKIVRRAASRAKHDGRFPDRWWQVWWQRWGIKGTRGDPPVSSFSNLLIMLVTIAGFDPAIRRFESFHPSQNRRQEPHVALECGSKPEPRREG